MAVVPRSVGLEDLDPRKLVMIRDMILGKLTPRDKI